MATSVQLWYGYHKGLEKFMVMAALSAGSLEMKESLDLKALWRHVSTDALHIFANRVK